MSTKKTTQAAEVKSHADETTKDEGAAPESTSAGAETATAADTGTTPATPEPPPPADDEHEQPLPELTVLILRDETIGGKDYRPGDTPKLPGAEVEALVARKAGDINHKAIAAARKARNSGANEEAVIE
ncbi:hypothetical protein [Vreelandella venusta]|uniref:hypothetical protein n=1 Tax=Vreelandella venusta TaxID=44935 RepID=UPI00200F0C98|nr:hypothetical protein [Halomonas venusta]UQI38815.1 hypothetical protein M3L73_11250 [Halomonas venusta]